MFTYDCICDNLGIVDNFKFDPHMRTPVLELVVPVDIWKPKSLVITHVEGKFGREQCSTVSCEK